jgi:endonuclease-3 related protein
MRLTRARLLSIYRALHRAYGPQHWWASRTRFEMMAGAVLVQNTNWANAARAVAVLRQARLLNPATLAKLPLPRLAQLIRSSGTHRVKAKRLRALSRWLVVRSGVSKAGKLGTDELRRSLLAVHGIGPETADCILVYAYARPLFIADAYARRFLSRLGFDSIEAGYEPLRKEVESELDEDADFFNEFHALIIRHAKNTCRADPACERCVFVRRCSYASA